jgi:hypothetical protein
MIEIRAVTVLTFLVSACCGGATQVPKLATVRADREPDTLTLPPRPPTAGPLLDLDICTSSTDEFASLVAGLDAYQKSGAPSLFVNISGNSCGQALTNLALACASPTPTPDEDDRETLNECLVLAASDPAVGDGLVQVALGHGPIEQPDCASAKFTAEAILALRSTVFAQLPPPRARACADAATMVAAGRTGCTTINLSACLAEVRTADPRGDVVLAGLLGQGPTSQKAESNLCPQWAGTLTSKTSAKVSATPISGGAPAGDRAALAAPAASHVSSQVPSVCTDKVMKLAQMKPDSRKQCKVEAVMARVADVCIGLHFAQFTSPTDEESFKSEYDVGVEQVQQGLGTATATAVSQPVETLPATEPLTNQGAILNGLADFLVAQAREEIFDYVADQFGTALCQKEVDGVELSTYFDETCHLLTGGWSANDKKSLKDFGSSVQHALENDVLALLPVLLNAATHGKVSPAFTRLVAALVEATERSGVRAAVADIHATCSHTDDESCALALVELALTAKVPKLESAVKGELATWVSSHGVDLGAIDHVAASSSKEALLGAVLKIVLKPESLAKTDLGDRLENAFAAHVPSDFSLERDLVITAMNTLLQDYGTQCAHPKNDKTAFGDEYACAVLALAAAWTSTEASKLGDLQSWMSLRLDATKFRSDIGRLANQPLHRWNDLVAAVARVFHDDTTPSAKAKLDEQFGQLTNRVSGVADLAYVAYHVGRALISGENPVRVFIAATTQIGCDYSADRTGVASAGIVDLRCALTFSGIVAEELANRRSQWPALDGDTATNAGELARFLTVVERGIDTRLNGKSYAGVREWARRRFGNLGKLALSGESTRSIRSASAAIFRALFDIDRELVHPAKSGGDTGASATPSEARVERAFAVGAGLLHAVLQTCVADEDLRSRATEVVDHSVSLVRAATRRDVAGFAEELFTLARQLGMPDPVPASLQQYIPLVTALATAKNADQAHDAFEKNAPKGWYRQKFRRGWHWSLTGLVGFAGGTTHGFGNSDLRGDCVSHSACTTTLFVPVGLDVTVGRDRTNKDDVKWFNGIGIMVSALDLGTIASVRFNSSDGHNSASPTYAQVASPGLYLRTAVYESPVVIGAGVSMVPNFQLDSSNTVAVWRFLVFATADVTLLGF